MSDEEAANNKAADLQRENAALKQELDRWKAGFALLHDETCDDENCTRISHQSDYVEKLQQELAALKEDLELAKRQAIIEDSYRRQFQEAWMKSQQELAALREFARDVQRIVSTGSPLYNRAAQLLDKPEERE